MFKRLLVILLLVVPWHIPLPQQMTELQNRKSRRKFGGCRFHYLCLPTWYGRSVMVRFPWWS